MMINNHFHESITFNGIHLLITNFIPIIENITNVLWKFSEIILNKMNFIILYSFLSYFIKFYL